MNINSAIKHYEAAKEAKVGSNIVCPGCGNKHVKTTYNKVFCSNAKKKKRKNCKDVYWNIVDPEKRCRNTPYYQNVISKEEHDDDFDDRFGPIHVENDDVNYYTSDDLP